MFWSDNVGGQAPVWMADPGTGKIIRGPAEFTARTVVPGPAGQMIALGNTSTRHFAPDGQSTEMLAATTISAYNAQFAPSGDRIALTGTTAQGTVVSVIVSTGGDVLETLPGIAAVGWVRA